MRHLIIILLIITSPVVFACPLWISGRLGGSSVNGPAISRAITYQVVNYPITFRNGWTEGGGDVVLDVARESLKEQAILIGYRIPRQNYIFSIGLSRITGRHRGEKIKDGGGGLSFALPTYKMDHYETTGVTLEFNGIKPYGSFFGLGFTFSVNLNKETTYFSALLSLNLGKIKTTKK